jgi:hypothetical protein
MNNYNVSTKVSDNNQVLDVRMFLDIIHSVEIMRQ